MAKLYVVATPIGNLEDVTLRALRILGEVGLIAAEDTRTTRKLLSRYRIKTPLTSYHDHNVREKIPHLLQALETTDVALVSEAGTPGISDPGRELVLEAAAAGYAVVPIPGPSAVVAALSISGLPVEGALFLGFLPRRKGDRRRLLESLRTRPHTVVALEPPRRLLSSLEDALTILGDRDLVICRELTKVHEEVFRGTISQALAHFSEPRGEFTLVLAGAPPVKAITDPAWATDELRKLKAQGLKAREAVATVTQASGLSRKEVYRLWLGIGSE